MRDTAQEVADRIREERRAAGQLGKVTTGARAISIHGTQRACEDTVVHVADAADHDDALETALTATGETRARLFGWDVGAPDEAGIRVVRLHTD